MISSTRADKPSSNRRVSFQDMVQLPFRYGFVRDGPPFWGPSGVDDAWATETSATVGAACDVSRLSAAKRKAGLSVFSGRVTPPALKNFRFSVDDLLTRQVRRTVSARYAMRVCCRPPRDRRDARTYRRHRSREATSRGLGASSFKFYAQLTVDARYTTGGWSVAGRQ